MNNMAEIVGIKVSLTTKQWPGNMNAKTGNGTNYSGGADLELEMAFEDKELPIDVSQWEESLKGMMESYISPLFALAAEEVLKGREVMVIPPTPTAPSPNTLGSLLGSK